MGSITGMKDIDATNISNSGEFRLGNSIDSGTAGQVILSGGPNAPVAWGANGVAVPNPLTMGTNVNLTSGNPSWDGSVAETINATDTDTTYTAGNGIDLAAGNIFVTYNDGTTINNIGGIGNQNQVLKVPNTLTINGTPYDGSAAVTLLTPDTTYTAGNGMDLTGTTFSTDNDGTTINNTGGTGAENQVLKVPQSITINATPFDGSVARNFTLATSDTTYQAGLNIYIDTTTTPDTIQLLQILTDIQNITFQSAGYGSTLTGNSYPQSETTATYLDLSDDTNITSPYCFHNVYDPVVADFDSLSITYTAHFFSNVNQDIVAKQTSLCIELLCYNYGSTSNRTTYVRLTDNAGTEFSSGTDQGGYGTGTRNTERIVHGMDETDKQIFRITWYIQGLTIGNTYTFNPESKTSGTFNYIAAGGNYPATFLRGYYLPS